MENSPTQHSEEPLSRKDLHQFVVRLLVRQLQDSAKENERLLNGLHFALDTSIDGATKRITERLDEIQKSIEILAREVTRRIPNGEGDKDNG